MMSPHLRQNPAISIQAAGVFEFGARATMVWKNSNQRVVSPEFKGKGGMKMRMVDGLGSGPGRSQGAQGISTVSRRARDTRKTDLERVDSTST
ncbi:hypothetical protein PGTUg99_021610 [Puccinia graminis f. sp. tritici]|uniref:Uncharacterized protein n=1 Tax=Puccinia graminis f. sp. tritici TaxID=56615 RepID=A0A5B0RTF8_PUCGR|nr:hypothetical protein PGTUg99_021610 [Puccinia graminis f. sp. tritici]